MELNDIFANVEVLKALATLIAAGAGVGILALIPLVVGAKGAQYWRVIKGYVPGAIELVNEPTDNIPTLADHYLDKLVEAHWDKMIATFGPEFLSQVEALLDKKLTAPPQEVNVPLTETAPTPK